MSRHCNQFRTPDDNPTDPPKKCYRRDCTNIIKPGDGYYHYEVIDKEGVKYRDFCDECGTMMNLQG